MIERGQEVYPSFAVTKDRKNVKNKAFPTYLYMKIILHIDTVLKNLLNV